MTFARQAYEILLSSSFRARPFSQYRKTLRKRDAFSLCIGLKTMCTAQSMLTRSLCLHPEWFQQPWWRIRYPSPRWIRLKEQQAHDQWATLERMAFSVDPGLSSGQSARLTGGNDRMKRIKMGKIQLAGKLGRAITMSSLRQFFEGWSVLPDRWCLWI